MDNLNKILDDFLSDQDQRLSKRTYNNYENVIELFANYLNTYAYNNLEVEYQDIFEEKCINGEKSYCEIFSVDKVNFILIEDFMTYFLVKKVMAGKELIKNTITVMRQLVKWLYNNSYISEEESEVMFSTINDLKDALPKSIELSDLIYEESRKNEFKEFDSYEEGNFSIAKIKPGKLWVEDFMGAVQIGPVIVPKNISSLAEEGWFMYLELGQKGNKYYILNSGNVYLL